MLPIDVTCTSYMNGYINLVVKRIFELKSNMKNRRHGFKEKMSPGRK